MCSSVVHYESMTPNRRLTFSQGFEIRDQFAYLILQLRLGEWCPRRKSSASREPKKDFTLARSSA